VSDVADAFRGVVIGCALLSALTFFLAARTRTSDHDAAIGSALYVLLPYYVLDIYPRFAFAELACFVWFPLVFHFAARVASSRDGSGWTGLTLSYAALAMTHLVSAYNVLFALVPLALILVARSGRWTNLLRLAGAGALALMCSGVFLVPMLAEREGVHLDCLTRGAPPEEATPFWKGWCQQYEWRRNFAFAGNAPPPGAEPNTFSWIDQIAISQEGPALAGAVLLLLHRRRSKRGPDAQPPPGDPLRYEGLVYFGLSAWTLLLQTPAALPLWSLWETVVPDGPVQHPIRLAGIQAVTACFVVSCSLAPVPGAGSSGWRSSTALASAFLLLASAPALVLSYRIVSSVRFTDPWDRMVPHAENLVVLPYIPRGVDHSGLRSGVAPPPRAMLLEPGRVEVLSWRSHARRIRVESARANVLYVRTFVYPGWRARIGDRPAEIRADTPLRTIAIDVPAGSHEIEIEFGSTPARALGLATTGSGLLLLLLLALRRRLRAHRAAGPRAAPRPHPGSFGHLR
jgi:hypothetical protein